MLADVALTNLTNHFLIAMPSLHDLFFARSVVYLCEHSERGALGLVINKPCDINVKGLFDKVELALMREDLCVAPVFIGGPVQTERGFVLHEPVFADADKPQVPLFASTLCVPGGLEMTTSKDVLQAIAIGAGPRKILISRHILPPPETRPGLRPKFAPFHHSQVKAPPPPAAAHSWPFFQPRPPSALLAPQAPQNH